MWHTMHWLVGGAIGELVLDRVARLVLGNRRIGRVARCRDGRAQANGPECTGERSLAYTTWQAVQPLER